MIIDSLKKIPCTVRRLYVDPAQGILVFIRSDFLIFFLFLSLGFAGKLNTKLTEADHIHIGKHYGSMSLASTEIRDLFQGKACGIAGCGTHGKGDQDLINVKTWIFASKIFGLQLLDRMDGIRRDHMKLVIDSCQLFQGIEKKRSGCAEKIGGFSAYDLSVRKFHSGGRAIGCFFFSRAAGTTLRSVISA